MWWCTKLTNGSLKENEEWNDTVPTIIIILYMWFIKHNTESLLPISEALMVFKAASASSKAGRAASNLPSAITLSFSIKSTID